MIGTGLTFAVGVGLLGTVVGAGALLLGEVTGTEMVQMVGRVSVVSFIVGVAFSGVLALVARGRTFERLSLGLVTALGAGVGLLYFGAISISGSRVWTLADALGNLAVLLTMGGGLAGGTLLLARRAGKALSGRDEVPGVAGGSAGGRAGVLAEDQRGARGLRDRDAVPAARHPEREPHA